MKSSAPTLPVELTDQIIDVLNPMIPSDIPAIPYTAYLPTKSDEEGILALLACATVCRRWLPRAQARLYASVWIQQPQTMSGLIATLTMQPRLAALVKRIVAVRPSREDAPEARVPYLPLLQLLSKHPKLEELFLAFFFWSQEYPLAQTARLGRHTSITRLTLYYIEFASHADFLHLVRSFDALVELIISGVSCERTSETTMAQLQARRPCWAPASLRLLDVGQAYPPVNEYPFLPLHLLGRDIHLFSFWTVVGTEDSLPTGPDAVHCIALYRNLRHLGFTLELRKRWCRPDETRPLSDPGMLMEAYDKDDPGQAYVSLHARLVRILTAVAAPTLRSLLFSLPFSMVHKKNGGLGMNRSTTIAFQYLHTRTGLLDGIFDRTVCDLLVGGAAFANLSRLSFLVYDYASGVYDSAWWQMQVRRRLPGLCPGILHVTVRTFENEKDQDMDYYPLWEPEHLSAPSNTPDGH